MSAAATWIVSLAVAVLVGGAATFYIRTTLLRRDETAAGIVALSAMSWREFTGIVLEALARRGYSRVIDRNAPAGDGSYTLLRDARHWLLSCKHGGAFVLGTTTVNDLASDIRLHNAAGGLLVTQGRIASEARGPAKLQHVELLDGPTLWPEVRDLMPPVHTDAIRAEADQRARQRTLLAWLVALVTGIAVFVALPAPQAPAPGSPQAQPAVASSPPAADAGSGTAFAEPDAATLETQRRELANAVSTLAMVDRAIWSTTSTLEIILLDTDGDAVAAICPLVLRYQALASSRIQLTPPAGSGQQVRFRQCRSY